MILHLTEVAYLPRQLALPPAPPVAELDLCHGATFWADFPGFHEFEECPMIYVLNAPDSAWGEHRVNDYETWIFFRNRQEWIAAYRAARVLRKRGNNAAFTFPPTGGVNAPAPLAACLAFKPAGSEELFQPQLSGWRCVA